MTSLLTWYGRSIRIPTEFGPRTKAFAASTLGIAISVLKEQVGDLRVILKSDTDTAYADREKRLIVITAKIFEAAPLDRQQPDATVTEAISCAMGMTLHEALHFKYSEKTIGEAFTKAGAPLPDKLLSIIYQIVEDVFIETEGMIDFPTLGWALEAEWDYFFNESRLSTKFKGAPPETLEELMDFMEIMFVAKNRTVNILRKLSGWEASIIELLYQAEIRTTSVSRVKLAIDIYNLLKINLSDKCKEEIELGRPAVGAEESNGDIPDDWKDVIEMLKSRKSGYSLDSYDKDLNEMLEGSKNQTFVYEESGVPIFIKVPENSFRDKYEIDKRYYNLSVAARQAATVNRPYGQAMTRGSRLKRLHRIATDGKIFAEQLPIEFNQPLEVLILVDCSGSMSGPNIKAALAAAHGAAIGLESGRNKVAVIGHSADIGYHVLRKTLNLYRLKMFNESAEKMRYRANTVCGNHHYLCQNRDGAAIRRVAQMFTTTRNSKKLIVISDGAPQASSYGGYEAVRDTKFAVAEVRKKGISVISISIEESAQDVNNQIYGEQYNVRNDDPNIIATLLTSLLK